MITIRQQLFLPRERTLRPSILAAVGAVSLKAFAAPRRWRALSPVLAALAVLLVTIPVKYNAGVRHVLVVFPLLAIVAARGSSHLWHLQGRLRLTRLWVAQRCQSRAFGWAALSALR